MLSRRNKLTIVTSLFFALIMSNLQADSGAILPAPQKISEHVYAWIGPHGGPSEDNRGYRMNMGFVVGDESVAVLESGFYPEMAEVMIVHIRQVTKKPIKYVINSNSQSDRFFGNQAFKKLGAKIIAHPKEIERMVANSSNYMAFIENSQKFKEGSVKPPVLPDSPLDRKTTISLGGSVEIEIDFYKAAHTPSPLFVHIKNDNVVYAGDILYSGRLLAIVPGGNIKQWMETFEYLEKFKDATFIPGHGEPAKLSAFKFSTYDYLNLLYRYMNLMVEDGVDMQDAIDKMDQSKFSKLENFEELSGRNANRAYQEAEEAAFD